MYSFTAETAFLLAAEHRQRLIDASRRRRRLRRPPVATSLPGMPPDAA